MIFTGGLFCNRSSIGLPVRSHCPSPRALAPLAPPPRRATLVSRCGRARCPHRAANPRTARAPLPCASVAALHYTRTLLGRRDEDIAPYRHYTREIRMHYPSRIAPWYGFVTPAPRPRPIAVRSTVRTARAPPPYRMGMRARRAPPSRIARGGRATARNKRKQPAPTSRDGPFCYCRSARRQPKERAYASAPNICKRFC